MILNKKLLEFGVLLGLISIGIGVLYYSLGIEFMIKWWVGLINLAVSIFLICFFALRYRKSIGGYMNYWNAFFALVIILTISGVISTIYNMILFHVIDPELPVKMHDAILQTTVQWMEDFKVPQSEIDKVIDKMQSQQNQYSVGRQLIGIIWVILGSAIISFIIAAFVKKSRPIMDETPLDQLPS